MHRVAPSTTRNQQTLVENVRPVKQVEPVSPKMKAGLEPFRKYMLVAPILGPQRGSAKEAS